MWSQSQSRVPTRGASNFNLSFHNTNLRTQFQKRDIPSTNTTKFSSFCGFVRQKSHIGYEHLEAFCSNTSLPGLKYLTEPHRPWYERILWLLGLAISLVACVSLTLHTWRRWRAAPVIVAMDENLRAVWDVPFPAITICPLARVNHHRFNFSDAIERFGKDKLTDEEYETLFYLNLQCNNPIVEGYSENGTAVVNCIEEHALTPEEIIEGFKVGATWKDESEFKPLMTKSGLCHTYNMIPGKEMFRENTFHSSRNYINYDETETSWFPDRGYNKSSKAWVYPNRVLGAGINAGVEMILRMDADHMDNFCTDSLQGFQISLHSPAHLPIVDQESFLVPLGNTITVAISPQEVITSEELRYHYTPKQRKCYYPDERRLSFFTQYTRTNCEIECLANITLHHCKCVAFYMPRTLDTNICGTNETDCLEESDIYFHLVESGLEGNEEQSEVARKLSKELGGPCDCKQSCAFITYSTERSQANMDIHSYFKQLNYLGFNLTDSMYGASSQWTILWMYYEKTYFIPTRRMELFGISTFIANCGGVLGLCLGMSILSAFELLYWFLVRPFWRQRKVGVHPSTSSITPMYSHTKQRNQHDHRFINIY